MADILRLIGSRLKVRALMDTQWLLRDLRVCIVDVVVWILCAFASASGLFLLAERFGGIGGFAKEQVLFMLGYGLTVEGLIGLLFGGENSSMPSRRFGRGQLDHMLMQPAPIWVQLLTDGFCPATGCFLPLTGISVTLWAATRAGAAITPLFLMVLLFELLCSTAVVISFQYLCAVPALYAPVAAEEVSTTVDDFFTTLRSFPLGGLHAGLRFVLCTLLPVGLVSYLPTYAVLNGGTLALFAPLAVAVLFGIAAALLLRRAIRRYLRVGSIRYSRRGFR